MAFQQPQTRRKPATQSSPRCTSPDLVDSTLATSLKPEQEEQEEGLLLFDSQSSWTLLQSPRRARLSRLDSYGSSNLTNSPGQGSFDHSLLPSHDGTGAFAQATSLRGTSVGSNQESSEEGELIGIRRGRGRTGTTTTDGSITGGSEMSETDEEGRWELTEEALSTLHSSNRLGLFQPQSQEQELEEEEGSVGFTSGSEEEDKGSDSQRSRSRRKGKGKRTNEEEQEMEQSLSALSAGITPRARRQLASRSPSTRPPLLPIVVGGASTSQRSLSPYYNISTLSQTSSDAFSVGSNGVRYKSKRRHRNAGSGSQTKRLLETGKFERIEEEEARRAERMKGVLEERVKENEIERAKKEVLLGDLASKLMSIDPSTYPLLATDDPTPVPSRAPSPPIFAQSARRELSSATFDSIGDTFVDHLRAQIQDEEHEEEEDEANLTETEGDSPHSPNLSNPSRPEPIERNQNWVHSSSPPVFAPRSPPHSSSFTSTNPLHLSRSRPNTFALPFSTYPHSLSLRPTNLSHEERIILSTSSSSNLEESAAPWGELDSSFEVYMNYWKRFLRRFKRASSGGREVTEGSFVRGLERDETGSERSRGEIY